MAPAEETAFLATYPLYDVATLRQMPGYHYYRAADALAFGHSYTRFQSAPATYTYESDTYVQAAIFSEYFLQAQLPHVHPAELEAEFFCLQERINQGATDVDIDHYLRLGLVLGLTIQSGSDAPSPLGDLTAQEVKRIQDVVDQVGRPIEVVGSAAKGERRSIGTGLPFGKGPGTRSDIDYIAPPASHPYFRGYEGKLPEIDPKTGIIPGVHNPHMGPAVRFEPYTPPKFIPTKD